MDAEGSQKPTLRPTIDPVAIERREIRDVQHPYARYFRYRLFTVYRRLFTLVFAGNLAAFTWMCTQDKSPTTSNAALLSIPIAANLFIAVLFRTDDFINLLYSSVVWIPLSLPLCVRRRLAKIYEFGGMHSGAATAATFWALLFITQITRSFLVGSMTSIPILITTGIIVVLLLAIIVMAYPAIRSTYHNAFERVHRFCGWTCVILYWVVNVLLTADLAPKGDSAALAPFLFTDPTTYFLIAITLLLILPWARLKHIEIHATQTSSHATRLYFYSLKAQPTQAVRISTSPLLEWHSFAIIPHGAPYSSPYEEGPITTEATGKTAFNIIQSSTSSSTATLASNLDKDISTKEPQGLRQSTPSIHSSAPPSPFSILVSAAGDWTESTISNPCTKRKIWFRGRPTTGVTKAALLFRSAVIVTTGSGIGPALSLLMLLKARARSHKNNDNHKIDLEKGDDSNKEKERYRLLWSTPSPLATYGPKLLAEIREVDSGAVIWDTRVKGRPDLARLAWETYRGEGEDVKGNGERDREERTKDGKGAYEAMFVVSNQRVTEEVVHSLESRGVPAFGPVFDS